LTGIVVLGSVNHGFHGLRRFILTGIVDLGRV